MLPRASTFRTCACRRLPTKRHVLPLNQTTRFYSVDAEKLDYEALKKQRRTEWKRRQGTQSFLDHLIINVRGGKGGNGCAAFHREKFINFGPPCGGAGGRGGDVYIMPTKELTTLASITKQVRGQPGSSGSGTWQNGRAGEPTIIKVPLGTVVRELGPEDTRRALDEWEQEEEDLKGMEAEDMKAKMREKRWLHFPGSADDNNGRDAFLEAEKVIYKEERQRRLAARKRALEPLSFDLDKIEELENPVDAPLGVRKTEYLGHLIAHGGAGGVGNTHFVTNDNRSPKYATRGHDGERRTYMLELKLIADIGLVGMPNAGKSTLLRALTGGRAKSEVASYAFTTLNPVVGVVRVAADGTFEGSLRPIRTFDETRVEEEQALAALDAIVDPNEVSLPPAEEPSVRAGHEFDLLETSRFTIADNPGLISGASENVGLGHSFLKSIERSLALAYVIDLSAPAPWDELQVLRDELEHYQPGMSSKARIVIANKADLLGGGGDPEAVEEAKAKLQRLEEYVRENVQADRPLDVVPVSAKFSQNAAKVVRLLNGYVQEAKAEAGAEAEAEVKVET
ncbi:GTP-binding protein Obg CgtA [Pterulicium gracile]|uniref:GTP-binding protein Obg CgtA n=1 Tax=Pterulicium gracile TaxID=1884261 RepID=A0A5C3QY85_9AGAR|nr:GTP-binding protein Obg CgtA [Pterula gracilis]